MSLPKRVFLDTNVYLTGFDQPDSVDGQILRWLADHPSVTVLICDALIEQIRRVATRNRHKDFAGIILDGIWRSYSVEFVLLMPQTPDPSIPREDWEIYLCAKVAGTDCFVSNNRELIRAIADFDCLTPQAFVDAYL